MDPEELQSKIRALPVSIQNWAASIDTINKTEAITKHFNVSKDDVSVIPTLLLRIIIRDLDPKYFAGELAYELKLERDRAMMITDEISRLVLYLVKKDLMDIGVDISGLGHFEMPVLSKAALAPTIIEEIKSSGETAVDLSEKEKSQERPLSEKGEPLTPFDAPAISRITFKIDSLGGCKGAEAFVKMAQPGGPPPVIIHEEQTAKPISSFPNFDLKFSKNRLSEVGEKRAPLKPAELEVRGLKKEEQKMAPSPLPKIPTEVKIIHYSQFKPSEEREGGTPAPMSSLPLESKDKKSPFWAQFKNIFSVSKAEPDKIANQKDAAPSVPGLAPALNDKPPRYPIPPKIGSGVQPVPVSGYKKISFSVPAEQASPETARIAGLSSGKKEEKRFSPAQLESKTGISAAVRVVDFNEKGNEISASAALGAEGKVRSKTPMTPSLSAIPQPSSSPVKLTDKIVKMDLTQLGADKDSQAGKGASGQKLPEPVQKKKWFSFLEFFSKDSGNSGSVPVPAPIVVPSATIVPLAPAAKDVKDSLPGEEKKGETLKKFPIPPKSGGAPEKENEK